MPIKSYLAHAAQGQRDELTRTLRALEGCGIVPALNRDVVVRMPPVLYLACAMLFVGVLIDKGIGTIIPGFVPEPWAASRRTPPRGWS